MIPYIVYSHSEFLDALLTQTYYLKSYDNKILLINKYLHTNGHYKLDK